jgi:hypothetical protein
MEYQQGNSDICLSYINYIIMVGANGDQLISLSYLSTARYFNAFDWFGDFQRADNSVPAAFFTNVFEDVLVLLFVQQILRCHHIHQTQNLGTINAKVKSWSNAAQLIKLTSVAGPDPPKRLSPGTWTWTGAWEVRVLFLAPTLAL